MSAIPFDAEFPRSAALGLKPVANGAYEGFDLDDVAIALQAERFSRLESFLSNRSVFVCGHRTVPHEVQYIGNDGQKFTKTIQVEAHCVYARDLDEFLAQEGV